MATTAKPPFMPSFKKNIAPVVPATPPVAPVTPQIIVPVAAPVAAQIVVPVEVAPVVATETVEELNIFEESTEVNNMSEEIVAVEEVVEVAVEASPKKTRKKSTDGSTRKASNRDMTKEDIDFIVANVKTMSYAEMAEARGLTNHQINRVLMTVKKDLKKSCNDDPIALAKIDIYIRENLSRPEESTGRSGNVKSNIDDIVGNILNSISSK